MQATWDPEKARKNLHKHGVTFEEAAAALTDPLALSNHDPDHSQEEDREITIAFSPKARLLVVSHADRGSVLRIISARPATHQERRLYEQ